jgi:hypothetical protein
MVAEYLGSELQSYMNGLTIQQFSRLLAHYHGISNLDDGA